jgi:hydroxyacylglutathione hydrolase
VWPGWKISSNFAAFEVLPTSAFMTNKQEEVISILQVGLLQCNCTIYACPESKECMVVDPGGDAEDILERSEALGCRIKYLLITHAHFDHILAAGELKQKAEALYKQQLSVEHPDKEAAASQSTTKVQIALHPDDLFLYDNLALQLQSMGMATSSPYLKLPPPDILLEDNQTLSIGNGRVNCKVLHTPGHTPGSCSYLFSLGTHKKKQLVATGDTLFCAGVGRTDLPGGDQMKLLHSIRNKLYALPDEVVVIPGHGPKTTIGTEKQSNPFVRTKKAIPARL